MKLLLKKLSISIAFVLLGAISVYAQVPQGFNFQAVARDASGQLLVEQNLGVKVSVLKGTETGTVAYSETHSVTTDAMGLIKIIIGEGTAEADAFNTVNWGNDNYFVKLAVDVTGGTEYEDLGVTRLLSVPYALVAENVLNASGGELGLNINIDTANPDTSFIVNLTGNEGPEDVAKAMQVFGNSSGKNRVLVAEAKEPETSTASQYAIIGDAGGPGTGSHIGVLASAINDDATGGNRYGVYGQASSKAKYNYGVFGYARGDGSGETEVSPETGDFGSFNLGGFFYATGNLNGNTGGQGIAAGDNGDLRNFGLIGTARTSASGVNIGVRGEAFNSTNQNIAFNGDAFGATKNIGMELHANGGASNIGMIVNADTAAIMNGELIVNGSLLNVGISNDPGGSDPTGKSSQIALHADVSPNFQFGGQSWHNNELAIMNIYGSTPDGNGWFHSNIDISVGDDGTHEWGGISIKKSHVANQTVEETINLDGATGNIWISGTLTQSSDERLKKDIKTIDGALEKTLGLRGVTYTWNDDSENENPQIGVVAQELESIFPELVHTNENGMKSVNYAQMTAILIEAVKELNTLVEDLQSENKILTAKVEKQNQLEQRIAQIEKILSGTSISKTQKSIISDK